MIERSGRKRGERRPPSLYLQVGTTLSHPPSPSSIVSDDNVFGVESEVRGGSRTPGRDRVNEGGGPVSPTRREVRGSVRAVSGRMSSASRRVRCLSRGSLHLPDRVPRSPSVPVPTLVLGPQAKEPTPERTEVPDPSSPTPFPTRPPVTSLRILFPTPVFVVSNLLGFTPVGPNRYTPRMIIKGQSQTQLFRFVGKKFHRKRNQRWSSRIYK